MNQVEKSRLGGLRRIQLYGNPGTPEGRSKGGKKSATLFRENPSFAKKRGFIIRKDIKYPTRCAELAEFIGILLGDGGVPGTHQFTISFNNKTDREYADYISSILRRLFSVDCHIHNRKNSNGADIVVNSSNLIDFLMKNGIVKGNKVKNQVSVPAWINTGPEYQVSCLRGLIDTDGSFYLHKYKSNGKTYTYLKLGFTNCSKPLLKFVFEVLNKLKYKVFLSGDNLSIGSQFEVKRYFREIGSHNPKHLNRFRTYFDN